MLFAINAKKEDVRRKKFGDFNPWLAGDNGSSEPIPQNGFEALYQLTKWRPGR